MSHRTIFVAASACLLFVLCGAEFSQTASAQTVTVFPGLNTVQYRLNSTATPDPTIAVGTLDYCEHVNSGYQCWYKSGVHANQAITFLGNAAAKSDSGPWSQNNNNGGATAHCSASYSPNSQLIHDNVYNLWVMEKRITDNSNGHNYMCVAISNVEDISSTSPAFAWFAMQYDLDTVIPVNSHGNFYYPDYPQVGLWQSSTSTAPPYAPANDQALWITYDLQDTNNQDNINGVLVCAVDLAGLRNSTANPYNNASKTPACTVAHPLATYNQRRSWVPANNSDTTPPIDADGEMFTYLIEPVENKTSYLTDPNHTQGVEQWTINWSATNPVPTEVNSWDLPSTQPNGDQLGCFNPLNYYDTVCVPQPSTATTGIVIDSVADRMQQFFHYTSNGGQGSVWTSAHAIQIVPNATSFTQTEADIRVLQRNSVAPNAVYLAGDYPIVDPVDPNAYVFLPSVVRDKVGNLQGILGISGTASDEHPGLDSWNFVPGTLTSGTWGYIASPLTDGDAEDTDSLNYRWGDWYSAVLDPSDSCTVWVAGEYLPSNRTTEPFWYTEMAKLPPVSTCSGAPVTLSSELLNFGNQQVGVKSSPMVETVTNNQAVNLTITSITAGGDYTQTNTCQQPIAPNGTCAISVYFTPSTTGTRTATLTITDGASNSPQTASLTGVGATSAITIAPSTLTFSAQILGTTSAGQKITVTNNGVVSLTINSVAASGTYAEIDNCAGNALTPGQACTITVSFTPDVTGTISGAITINDTATGSPHVVSLTGTGQLSASLSANLNFAAFTVGTAAPPQTMTLTNNQSSTFNYTFSASGDYSAVGNNTSPCNGSLAAKAKCTFAVGFTPTTNGIIKGSLAITATGSSTPAAVGGMTGTGQNGPTSPFTFSPSTLSFGNVAVSTSSSKTVTVKNVSGATLTINSVSGAGYYSVVPSGATPCGGSIATQKSCTVTVTFTPQVVGSSIGGITLSSNSSSISTEVQDQSGTGVLPVTLSPASISFGTVKAGSTSPVQVVTVTNNTNSAVSIISDVASGGFLATTGGNPACGASIPANSICTLGVEFTPTVVGSASGVFTLNFSAASSPQEITLAGTGN